MVHSEFSGEKYQTTNGTFRFFRCKMPNYQRYIQNFQVKNTELPTVHSDFSGVKCRTTNGTFRIFRCKIPDYQRYIQIFQVKNTDRGYGHPAVCGSFTVALRQSECGRNTC